MAVIKYEKTPRVLPPEGRHVMRCFWVVDLGTQKFSTGEGRKIWFSFELPEAAHRFKENEPEQPFSVSNSFFWGFGPKAKLRLFVEAWRGKPYTEEEAQEVGFDPAKLLGKGAEGVIVHNGEYANIQTIMPLRRASDCPDPVNKPVYVSLEPEEFDMRSFDRLPEFLRKMIEKSPEWSRLVDLGATDGSFDLEEYLAKKNEGQAKFEQNREEWNQVEKAEQAKVAKSTRPSILDDEIPMDEETGEPLPF